jgi:hypothetical protein
MVTDYFTSGMSFRVIARESAFACPRETAGSSALKAFGMKGPGEFADNQKP